MNCLGRAGNWRNREAGFSLVEVVLALAIMVFAGFTLVGLLQFGLQNTHDSKEQLQAATLAEKFCSTRRAAPSANLTDYAGGNFPLPVLTASANNLASPTYLTWDGLVTTKTAAKAHFGLLYTIVAPANYAPSTAPGSAMVNLCLFWPALAPPANSNTGRFELTTSFALP